MNRALLAVCILLVHTSAVATTLIGASPLAPGERALRLAGGLASFLPQGAAGVPLLGSAFAPILPRGSVAVGFGAGEVDAFAVYETVAGWLHEVGGEARIRFFQGERIAAAVALRLGYEMRGIRVKTVSFAGALRVGGDARVEVRLSGASLVFAAGATAELLESEHVGGESLTDVRPLLSSYDASLGVEWPWGKNARFFVRASARIAADPAVQLDRAVVALEVGGGFPF